MNQGSLPVAFCAQASATFAVSLFYGKKKHRTLVAAIAPKDPALVTARHAIGTEPCQTAVSLTGNIVSAWHSLPFLCSQPTKASRGAFQCPPDGGQRACSQELMRPGAMPLTPGPAHSAVLVRAAGCPALTVRTTARPHSTSCVPCDDLAGILISMVWVFDDELPITEVEE
ncbi:hypothetical protein FHT76_007798 [Rhizobium sp. BK176]|nr:hypothetical protein [Rhizobium sp. BK399]MCS4096077.1 hypothetical protein [Rhizobium sp. BK176]